MAISALKGVGGGGGVTGGQVILSLHHTKLCLQVGQQLLLCLCLAHHSWHLLPQMTHDQYVYLGSSHALHKLIYLAICMIGGAQPYLLQFVPPKLQHVDNNAAVTDMQLMTNSRSDAEADWAEEACRACCRSRSGNLWHPESIIEFHGSEQTYTLKLGRKFDYVMQQQSKCTKHSVPE